MRQEEKTNIWDAVVHCIEGEVEATYGKKKLWNILVMNNKHFCHITVNL